MTLEQKMAEGREQLRRKGGRKGEGSASRIVKQRRDEIRQMTQPEQIAFYNALSWTERRGTLSLLSWAHEENSIDRKRRDERNGRKSRNTAPPRPWKNG